MRSACFSSALIKKNKRQHNLTISQHSNVQVTATEDKY